MKILIASPLYPPDIKEPAPYVKELARRMAAHHDIGVLVYNHLPEKVAGVTFSVIRKSERLPIRLIRFFLKLRSLAQNVDVLYVQNGPSVEVPLLLFLLTKRKRPYTVLRLGDITPLKNLPVRPIMKKILSFLMRHVNVVVTHHDTAAFANQTAIHFTRPNEKPEILPLTQRDNGAWSTYEASWEKHVASLELLFSHGKN